MNKQHSVHGMTLVEILISTAILAAAMGIALSVITRLSSAGRAIDRRNEMVVDSNEIFKSLSNDVALSGWATYDWSTTDFAGEYPEDRTLRYYPYVIQQAPIASVSGVNPKALTSLGGGLQGECPTWFQSAATNWFIRPNQLVKMDAFNKRPNLAATHGAPTDFSKNFTGSTYASQANLNEAYRRSFYARSQELILVRAAVGGWSSVPGTDTTPVLRFPTGDWVVPTKDVGGGVTVKDRHDTLGVIRMSEWQLGDANADTASTIDVRDPKSFYWNRSAAPTGLRRIPVAVNLGAMLSPQSDPGNLVQIRWDTMTDPSLSQINMTATPPHPVIEFPAAQSGNARIKATQLREYLYAVVPSDVGAGRLIRAHTELRNAPVVVTRAPTIGDSIGTGTNPDGAAVSLIIDKVYTDNCMRINFDTYRTDLTNSGLKPNQIRVTLYLAMSGQRVEDAPMTYVTSTLLTMRVLNSSVDNDSITTILGSTVPGLAF